MANRIQLRRDTAANWTAANPVLALGEKAVETDTKRQKLGDGTTAWNALGYLFDKTSADPLYARLTQVAPGVTMVNARGLRRWWAKLAGAMYAPAVCSIYGDSVSVGAGSDGNSAAGGDDSIYRQRGYAAQLRSLFAVTYGDPGEGMINGIDNGGRVTLNGGAIISRSTGAWEGGIKIDANAQSVTFALPACTEIDIYGWDGGSGGWTYNVDSGAKTGTAPAYTNDGASTAYNKLTVTGLANTTHTLTITGSGTVTGSTFATYISGVVARKLTTGVQVHRIARSGYTAAVLVGQDSYLGPAGTAVQARMLNAQAKTPVPDLAILTLGTNDFKLQNSTGTTYQIPGSNPTDFATFLNTFIPYITGGGGCVLLLAEPRRATGDLPSPMTYTEQQYVDQMKAIAAATDHVAFLDLGDLLGNNTNSQALGFQYSSGSGGGWSVHPTLPGHGAIAQSLHRVLSQSFGPNAPST